MGKKPIVINLLVIFLAVMIMLSFFSNEAFVNANEKLFNDEDFGKTDKYDNRSSALQGHNITNSELTDLKESIGVYQIGNNYNEIILGYGTGLSPPTFDEWNEIAQNTRIIDNISYSSPSAIDNSDTPWFPPIGNQGKQGSCTTWAVGYYVKTYQEAKEHSWNLSGATWTSGQPTVSYQNQIMSPAFIYNLINDGEDKGTSIHDSIRLINNIGTSSWQKMPYNPLDYITWPSEAAWTEAALYRGNSSFGFQYLYTNTSEGITNLKNWLAAGNLAVIAVDANQYPNLTAADVWTSDNYQTLHLNHANTIVGYNDTLTYTENGELHNGAFKIANSWGSTSGWENVHDGFYWISYEAMKKLSEVPYSNPCIIFEDLIDYEPKIQVTFNINDAVRSNCAITVGLGEILSPIVTKNFSKYVFGGNHPFCANNIIMDITEFQDHLPLLYNQSFFLNVYDNRQFNANGIVNFFAIGNFSATGTPLPTIKYQNVILTLIYNPTTISCISLIPEGISSPISNDNTFTVSYYLGNETQIDHIQNGQITCMVDKGSKIILSGVSNASTSIEKWVLNLFQEPVTLSSEKNSTLYYYHLLSQNVGYLSTDTSFPSPDLIYCTAPISPSSQSGELTISVLTLPLKFQQQIWVLKGTTISVENNFLGSSNDRWATSADSWNITRVNQINSLIVYYHQYQINASYITDGSIPTPEPFLSGIQFGINIQFIIKPTTSVVWLDENTLWSICPSITTISGTERLVSFDISGNATESRLIVQSYNHQYYLTVISPHGTSTGSGWYNSTSTTQATLESAVVAGDLGTQYVFSGWSGNISGREPTSDPIIMNSPKLAIAKWTTQYQVQFTNSPTNVGSITSSKNGSWVEAGNQTISATASRGYSFSKWTANTSAISFADTTAASTMVNINGPGTITAEWFLNPTSSATTTATTNPTNNPTSSPTEHPRESLSPTPSIPELSLSVFLFLMFLSTLTILALKKKNCPFYG